MKYWIFVSARNRKNKSCPPPREIYNQRMKDAFWGLSKGTNNRNQIKQGDQVIFYVADPDRTFAGTAQLESDYFKTSEDERSKHSHGREIYEAHYGVDLTSIHMWPVTRPISDLIPKLEFIKNTKRWWDYLQGGIVPISEQDYSRITERSLVTP